MELGLTTLHYSCVESIAAGDVDGDGWVDVVLAALGAYGEDSRLYWYKNPQGAGAWTEYTIDSWGYSFPEVADIDLDGKSDIVWYNGTNTCWYTKDGEGWIRNVITSAQITKHYAVGDVDNDGDLDIIRSGRWYVNPTDPQAPTVESVVVNDGESQRSMVASATVTFSGTVTLDPGVFEIIRRGDGAAVTVGFEEDVVGDKTVATLTFSGDLTEYDSLVDGNYQLTILDDKVHDSITGLELDGDDDSSAGGNYLFGEEEADAFFRLYGDSDGDRDVDMMDFSWFRGTMNKTSGDPGYLRHLDRDGDGDVDMMDFWYFRSGFGNQMLFA